MEVKAVQCPKCLNVIYPRTEKDCVLCDCKLVKVRETNKRLNISTKVIGTKICRILVNATKQDLYNDWKHKTDKFGKVKTAVRIK